MEHVGEGAAEGNGKLVEMVEEPTGGEGTLSGSVREKTQGSESEGSGSGSDSEEELLTSNQAWLCIGPMAAN
jgi:hypothetical protein